ncbi:hypothetical protein MBCUT_16850 [Methanobrevibacter cuticularis]|uniref:Uncharacterized protein n=1 Tax=Methanobrevibacter cuticularis TaxID=47311 RepID=A0A166D5E4_9EURY|nr:hypothetical protein [Methanobrevibacter cuticularis]KZX15225.1 hypothetical protein MBCUT_16850 [Methanobrevibacter cuticularis]
MFKIKIKNEYLFVLIVVLFLAIFSVNAVSAIDNVNDSNTNNLKFITKEAKLNQNNQVKVQLFNSKGQTLENKTIKFYVYNKKYKKYKHIGQNTTNFKGIASLKFKFKEYGNIGVKTNVIGDNFEKSAKIFVPKAYLYIKNSYSKKVDGAVLYSTIYNKGPNKTNFKIYYKFSKDFNFPTIPVKYKYTKPKASIKKSKILKMVVYPKGKYLYVYGTIKAKGKIKIKWGFESLNYRVSIKPVVKSSSTKILGNNPLKFRITYFTKVPDIG